MPVGGADWHAGRMDHVDNALLEAGLDNIRGAPRAEGRVELIVCRPTPGARRVLDEASLDTTAGLVGDGWLARGNRHTPDGSANPAEQLTLMNARAAALIAGPVDRWPLAGDQLYVEFDLSGEHLPPGTRVAIGTAVVTISEEPHTGCAKFSQRFGRDALRFVNSPAGRALNLRGINTKIVESGIVRVGDTIRKL